MAWGSHRQTFDMLMFGLTINNTALMAYATYALATGASLPWNPSDPKMLAIKAYPTAA